MPGAHPATAGYPNIGHVFPTRHVNQMRNRIIGWRQHRIAEIDRAEIGPFAHLNRADLVVEVQCPGTIERRHPKRFMGIDRIGTPGTALGQ